MLTRPPLRSVSGPINIHPIIWAPFLSTVPLTYFFTIEAETPNDPELNLYTIDVLVSKNGGAFTKFQLFPTDIPAGFNTELYADIRTGAPPYITPVTFPYLQINKLFYISFWASEPGNALNATPVQGGTANTYSFRINWYKNSTLAQSTSILIWNSPLGSITYTP